MPRALWGAIDVSLPLFPRHLLGYLLLFSLIAATFAYIRFRLHPTQTDTKHPALFPTMLLGALLCSQLLPLQLPFGQYWLQPGLPANAGLVLLPLSAVFLLLASLLLAPLQAIMLAVVAGFGYAAGQTGQINTLFHPLFFVVVAAACLKQRYEGQFYAALRQPIVAGLVAAIALLPLIFLTTLADLLANGWLAAVDVALASMIGGGVGWLLAALIGSLIVTSLQRALPALQLREPLTAVPLATSLKQRLQSDLLLVGSLVLPIIMVATFAIIARNIQTLMMSQMSLNADATLAQLPHFRAEGVNELTQIEQNGRLFDDNPQIVEEILTQSLATSTIFEAFVLLEPNFSETASARVENTDVQLTAEEYRDILPNVDEDQSNSYRHLPSQSLLLLYSTLPDGKKLVGHVSPEALGTLVTSIDDMFDLGGGFLLDRTNALIVDTTNGQIGAAWQRSNVGKRPLSSNNDDSSGSSYIGRLGDDSLRHLIYETTRSSEGWQIVATVPYTVVLADALGNSGWLGLLLLGSLGLLYVRLNRWGDSVTQPIEELAGITQRVAAGEQIAPTLHQTRQDEIGQLSHAFSQMQHTIDQRLQELNLLLDVSNAVSSSMVLQKGLPKVLDGVLKGTQAAGARVVLINQTGNRPIIFGAGEAGEPMEQLDRRIMKQVRQVGELVLSTPADIRESLVLEPRQDLPVAALCAMPIEALSRFQGILWLGYANHHSLEPSEQKLIQTLARQTAVLVENAILFAGAEGGRRQLKAILSSTSNAVIVTDATGRISLINPAFEEAFGVSEAAVKNRPLAQVIPSEVLVEALTSKELTRGGQELETEAGRTFFANISTINPSDGQTMGRVAVLQDITSYKEADELKSEFVATVSHDLRSPLTFMRGFATMLPMVGDLNERQSAYIFKIMNGIDQMSALVEDLLDLRRIDEISRMEEKVNIPMLVRTVAAEYRHMTEEKGMPIRAEIGGEIRPVTGDEKSLHSAIVNLVENAIKYAADGGELLVKAQQSSKEVLISVSDRGPGIPKKDQALIFEQFYRAKQRGEERIKGSGLGLALVKKVAQRHGGRVWCESEPGKGATFVIALPISGES